MLLLRPCHGIFYRHVKYQQDHSNLHAKVNITALSAHRSQKAHVFEEQRIFKAI